MKSILRYFVVVLTVITFAAPSMALEGGGCNSECTYTESPVTGLLEQECNDLSAIPMDLGMGAAKCSMISYCRRFMGVDEDGNWYSITECTKFCKAEFCYNV